MNFKPSVGMLGSVAASIAATAILQFVPALSFFFAIPLFTVLFLYGQPLFAFSAVMVIVLDVAVNTVRLLFSGQPPSFVLLLASGSGTFLLTAPLFCMLLTSKLRSRYRISLSGVCSAFLWVAAFAITGLGGTFNEMLRTVSQETSSILKNSFASVSNPEAVSAVLSPESLYQLIHTVLLYSLIPLPVILYAASWRMGLASANVISGKKIPQFRLDRFYNDRIVLYVISAGMIGVILKTLLNSEILGIVSWNILLTSAFWLVLQGAGILFFFMARVAKKNKLFFWLASLLLVMSVFNGWPIVIGSLLIAGVTEQFVPIRRRFDNKDTVDPTPGSDSDQHQ